MAIRAAAALLVTSLLALGVVACGIPPPSPPPSTSVPTAPSSPPVVEPSAATGAPPTASPSLDTSPAASPAIAVDATLLDILPAEIDGIAMRPDPETATEIAAAPGLSDDVLGLAVALYVGSEATGSEDLAIVNIVETRPDVATDGWFRSWRETYDAAACEPAGGTAVGGATAEIAGRVVHIGTCENGGHTYHVRLEDPVRIVSITAIGELRLGERIVAELKE